MPAVASLADAELDKARQAMLGRFGAMRDRA